jgi:hypothetical protein
MLGPGAGNAAGPSQISGEVVCATARPLNIIAKLKEHIAKIFEFIFDSSDHGLAGGAH